MSWQFYAASSLPVIATSGPKGYIPRYIGTKSNIPQPPVCGETMDNCCPSFDTVTIDSPESYFCAGGPAALASGGGAAWVLRRQATQPSPV